MVTLINARATKIEVVNNLTESGEISIDTVNEFNVNYAEDGEHCRGILRTGFKTHVQPEMLTVSCTVVGEFGTQKIASDEDKKKIHVECYNKLFPYAQALVSRLCTDAGLPPFFIQPIEMKEENVVITD